MQLTNTERLMLVNQYRILAKLNDEDEETGYYSKKAEILERGYEWYYDELLSSEPLPKEVSDETMDILDMFRQLDAYVDQLTEEQRATLDLNKLKFDGFDANNDRHYGFAKFIIEKDDRYDERKEMYLNSHTSASIDKYRRMLPVYNERKAIGHLTIDDLRAIQDVA
jgi:hypothetical protein